MKGWFLLVSYSIVVATSQMLWLTFSPVTSQVATLMHTTSGNIVIYSLVFPLVYIILAIPMSWWLDRNFIPAVTAGALLTGIGGVLRLILPYSFLYQLGMQIFISIGQPLILGSLSIVAVYYFMEKDRPVAISIGSLSLFIGIIAATAGGFFIFQSMGYYSMLVFEAVPGVVGMVSLPLLLKRTDRVGTADAYHPKFSYSRLHLKLAAMLFVGMGIFDALDSWLEPMLVSYHLQADAGNLIALMTLMGIFGAAVLPKLVSERRKRRLAITVIIGFSFLSLGFLGFLDSLAAITVSLAFEGFFLLAGLPILIEWGEQATPPQFQGRVTSLLMLAGNLGGLIMIVLGEAFSPFGDGAMSLMMIAFVVVLIPILLITPTNVTYRAVEAAQAGD